MTTVAELDAQLEARLAEKHAEKARQHFPTYCALVHNRPLYAHQLAWNALLDDPSEEDILIVAPPGTYKSTLFRMRMEWELGQAALRGEDLYTLYLMNVEAQSEKQIMAIEETLESNPQYRRVFPMVQADKDKGWTKQVVFIRGRKSPDKEPNILGTGFLGPYQGYHFHRIYVDDPSDPEDVMSETVMESQRYRLRGMLRDRKRQTPPKGRIRVILTPWGVADLRRDFKEMGFRIIEHPIEGRYPWGRLLMPEVFGDDTLAELRRVKGSALFDLSYMLREEAAEGNLIKREWFKLFNQEPQFSLKMQMWDIAVTSQETGDYSVCGTWELAENGYYLLDVERKQVETPELIDWMRFMAERERPHYILMLTAGVGKPVYQMLRRDTRLSLMEAPVETKDPVIRLREVLPTIEAGRVWLKAGMPWVPGFLDEMATYTGYQRGHDDQVAMLSGALRWLKARDGGEPGRGLPTRRGVSNSIISER